MFANSASAALAPRPWHLDMRKMTYRSHEHRTHPPFCVIGKLQKHSCEVIPYNGLAIHTAVLIRLENFLLYSSFSQVTNQSS
jgi:hypothetical protein